ncbi:MAG: hypothetical protein QM571_06920 [Micrococcaceae bacterium]
MDKIKQLNHWAKSNPTYIDAIWVLPSYLVMCVLIAVLHLANNVIPYFWGIFIVGSLQWLTTHLA